MTLTVTVNAVAIADAIPPTSVQSTQRADDGDVGFGGFLVDDPDALITTTGHHLVTVEESACSQPRLFTGYLTERDTSRSIDRGMIAGDDARVHDATMVDLNACFAFRVLQGAAVKRPAETTVERLTWLLAHESLAPFIEDTGFVTINAVDMDAADYTGATAATVLQDIVDRGAADQPLTYFAFWDPVAAASSLYLGDESVGIGESTLSISNDLADIDGTSIFAPDAEAKLARTPEEVYSEVVWEYAHGTRRIYRRRESTATVYGIDRGTTVQRPYTGLATTAQAQAERWLTKHSVERDTITVSILVPPESAGLAVAGQRITLKLTHLDGYADWTSMRIVTSTITPVNDVANLYRVELVLVLPVAASGGCICDTGGISLVQSAVVGEDDYAMANPQEITLTSTPTCGNLLVMVIYAAHLADEDLADHVVVEGFTKIKESYATAYPEVDSKYLSVWARTVAAGDGATWDIYQPNDPATGSWGGSGAIFLAEYSGARIDTGTPQAAVRLEDLTPALPDYTPASSGPVELAAAVFWQPGEAQTPADYSTIYDSGNPGFGNRHRMAFFTRGIEAPSGAYSAEMSGLPEGSNTHIIHFALAECETDEEVDLAQTPTSTVIATTAPTANDDAGAGYSVGQTWVDSTTGSVYTLVDSTAGAAVWQPALTESDVIALITPDIYFCDSLTVIDSDGVIAAGTHADLHAVGGTTVEIEEVTGTPGFNVEAAFSGVDGLSDIYVHGYYTATHTVTVDLYNYDTTAWDTVLTLATSQSSMGLYHSAVADGTPYYDGGGNAKLRFYHADAGNITHRLYLDYVSISHVAGSTGGLALDDLTDVDAPAPGDGDVLTYDDGSATWVPVAPSGGVTGAVFHIVAGFDAGTSAITGNPEVDVVVPASGTITGWTLLANTSGNAVVDIWSDTYGNFPPTDADSITAAAPPTLTTAAKATGADPGGDGWDTALTAGDILRFHLDSSSTVARLVLTLTYTRS